MELRGHEHTIEVVVFAPVAAYAAIRELAGIPVCIPPNCVWNPLTDLTHSRAPSGQTGQQHTPQQDPEIGLSSCGTPRQGSYSAPL